jgi:hypothetical protein
VELTLGPDSLSLEAEKPPESKAKRAKSGLFDRFSLCKLKRKKN